MGGKANARVGNVVLHKEVLLLVVANEVPATRFNGAGIVEGHAVVAVSEVAAVEAEGVVGVKVEVDIVGEVKGDIGSLGGILVNRHLVAEVATAGVCFSEGRFKGTGKRISKDRVSFVDEASESGAGINDGATRLAIGGDLKSRGWDIEKLAIDTNAGHVHVVELP